MIISLSAYRTSLTTKIEERLSRFIQKGDPLSDAIHYALLGPGKRIRPLLVIMSAETFGISSELALDAACALEMVHTYSLIHDDLPCMDDDDLRRGRPTVHRVYGEAVALLAGDALLTHSFEMIAKADKIENEVKLRLIDCLAKRAGKQGMIGGQIKDITASQPSFSESLEMFEQKTGDLFSCSLEFGALLGKASPKQIEEMRSLGLCIGLAYQLRDDLIDSDGFLDPEQSKNTLQTTLSRIDELLALLPVNAPLVKLISSIF